MEKKGRNENNGKTKGVNQVFTMYFRGMQRGSHQSSNSLGGAELAWVPLKTSERNMGDCYCSQIYLQQNKIYWPAECRFHSARQIVCAASKLLQGVNIKYVHFVQSGSRNTEKQNMPWKIECFLLLSSVSMGDILTLMVNGFIHYFLKQLISSM